MIFSLISLVIDPLLIFKNINIYSSIISLVVLYKPNSKKENLIISVIIGLLYDIFYSNLFINIFLFFIISLLINYYFEIKKYNLKNVIIISLFIIFTYNTICFLILRIFNINTYSYIYFLSNLFYIYIINTIYTSLSYLFINRKNKNIIKW